VPSYRLREAADLLGVSDDTLRRWADAGRLDTTTDAAGKRIVEGAVLAQFAEENAAAPPETQSLVRESARNRFVGLVTDIVTDKVAATIELQCGPYRVVSLMTSEAVRELDLELGSVAVAVVKATTVIIEKPQERT
jgi:molybdopterin-binding protein